MRFSIYATKDAMQFNLTPETEHEKEFLRMLNKYKGNVKISAGVDVSLTQGDYLRSFGERGETVAITINASEKP